MNVRVTVEAWMVVEGGAEGPREVELAESHPCESNAEAQAWAWEKLCEGYFVRIWRRQS